jgi:hypothetical protein
MWYSFPGLQVSFKPTFKALLPLFNYELSNPALNLAPFSRWTLCDKNLFMI